MKIGKELLKSISDHEDRITRLEQILLQNSDENNRLINMPKQLSLRELMRKTRSLTNVEKVLLVGYFLEQYEGFKSFNADDIKQALQTAKEPELSNTLAFITQNIKNGNIMEVKEKKNNRKAYMLTGSGEDLVRKFINEGETKQ